MSSNYKNKNREQYSINGFQLENLISNNIAFLFFNLSADFTVESSSEFMSLVFKLSVINTEAEIKNKINKSEKQNPIILICKNGDKSSEFAQSLYKEGYINTFFLEGGIVSLIS